METIRFVIVLGRFLEDSKASAKFRKMVEEVRNRFSQRDSPHKYPKRMQNQNPVQPVEGLITRQHDLKTAL
jgi:hypothetical protein